jgi:uncharacterized protein DUF6318
MALLSGVEVSGRDLRVNRSRSAIVVAAVALVLLVGACSGEPKPKFAPPESSSPTGSPSRSTPDHVESGDTTARFINDYFAAVGDSTTTGDTSAFVRMSSPSCQNCQTLAHNVEAAYEGGGHIEGGDWTVSNLRRVSDIEMGTIWNVDVETSRERWYDGDDHLIKIVRASTERFAVIVSQDRSRHLLRDMRLRS